MDSSSGSGISRAKYPSRILEILNPDGTTRRVNLQKDRLTIGRQPNNDLSFPDDQILSRLHMAFEFEDGDWFISDLNSKNGTLLNDHKLETRTRLKPGDRVNAGRLAITFTDPRASSRTSFVFVDEREQTASGGATMVIRLDRVLTDQPEALEAALGTDSVEGVRRTEALIHAGRELVGHRPLEELFPLILQLSTKAVSARRGLLMTLEGDDLIVRAAQGEGFRISTAVRDKVLKNRESLLVKDAGADDLLKGSKTIVEQRVRSLMAVPLQTEDKVIGLIYVDSPDFIRPFTAEDLSLLTVMANTAAMRIEHARLAEVEQMERVLENELEQASEIQRNLLPRTEPHITGLEVSGHSVPCRSVGGDYFDYLTMADGIPGLVVADVAGKGLPAALMMTSLHARVQIIAEIEHDPGTFMTRLNRSVAAHCPGNRFITFFLAVFDVVNGELRYANAGHNPPLLIRADGELKLLEGGGPPLGILSKMTYETMKCPMDPGDTLFLYSDGIPEAVNSTGEEFGDDRLYELAKSCSNQPARNVIDTMRVTLAQFVRETPANDDITMVVARRTS